MGTSYYGLSGVAPDHSGTGQMTATGGGSLTQSTSVATANNVNYIQLTYTGGVVVTGSLPSPTGAGWWLDVAGTVEGTTIPGGTWEFKTTITVNDSGAPTGTLTARASKFNFNTVTWTTICTATSGSQTLSSGTNAFDLTATGVSSVTFASGNPGTGGESLYVDFYWDQTSGGDAGTTMTMGVGSGSSLGVAGASGGMEVIAPASGSIVSGSATFVSNSVLAGSPATLMSGAVLVGNAALTVSTATLVTGATFVGNSILSANQHTGTASTYALSDTVDASYLLNDAPHAVYTLFDTI